MFGQIDEIKNLAFKYSKQELGRMVQMGMVDPQKAMMAGMMRDRVSQEDAKPPTTTVAQDVLGTAPQMQQPAQPQQPQMGMPQAPAPQAPTQMAATGGVTSLPVHEQDYAGGGIVAFAQGGYNEYGENPDDVTYDSPALDEIIGGLFDSNYRPYRPPVAAAAAPKNGQIFPSKTDAVPEPTKFIDATTKSALPPPPVANPAVRVGTPRLPSFQEPSGKINVQEFTAKPVQELKDIRSEKENYYKDLGIDPDVYNKMIEKEEGKRGEFGKRKEEAKGEFLMNLGLGIATSKRGREAEGASEGASRGLASYKESMKDVRAAEEKLDDRINSFRLADQQAKKTGADSDIAKRDHQADLVEAAKAKTVEAKNAAASKEAEVGASLYHTKMSAQTQLQVAQMHTAAQKEYTTALKQQGLRDHEIAQITNLQQKRLGQLQADPRNSNVSPAILEQQAWEYAQSSYKNAQGMVGGESNNAPAAPAGNLPPLSSFLKPKS